MIRLQHQCFYALSLLNKGKADEALTLLKSVFAANPRWRDVVTRVASVNSDEPYAQMLEKILIQ